MRQSSANNRVWDLTASGRSLMWQRKRSGPNTVPWGTPESTLVWLELHPSTTTCILLSVRKERSQSWMEPLMPYLSSFWRRRSWGTVSNAFEKSNIAKSICLPESKDVSRSCTVVMSWVSVEYPALKPWFRCVRIFCDSKWEMMWMKMMCSSVLQDTDVSEIGR